MFEIEARGLLCPKPIIMAKVGLEENEEIKIIVSEEAVEDLEKLAEAVKATFEKKEIGADEFEVIMKRTGEMVIKEEIDSENNFVIAIGNNKMGSGVEELGKKMMKSFIYTVSETKPYPSSIIFYNDGVYLTTEGTEVLDDLKKLAFAGVKIVSCGTCISFHDFDEKLLIGEVSNMYDIYEAIKNADKNITLE